VSVDAKVVTMVAIVVLLDVKITLVKMVENASTQKLSLNVIVLQVTLESFVN